MMENNNLVTLSVAREYIRYHEKFDWEKLQKNPREFIAERQKILDRSCSLGEKKNLIFALAHIGAKDCVDVLEKYQENPDQELISWSRLALDECRMFLNS